MKTKKSFGILLLFLCIINFTSCSDNEEIGVTSPLSFEKGYYEVPLIGKTRIDVRDGNRDYDISVENSSILDVSVDLSSSIGAGTLVITPQSKGETTITVKDNISNETTNLKIKVIDSYLVYLITESNHTALSKGTIVYLVKNANKDCYFFRYNNSEKIDSAPLSKGTYDFFVKIKHGIGNSSNDYAIPYLTLNYASNEEGNFTDATIPKTPHHFRFELFDGITAVNTVIKMIQSYLGIDWEELTQQATKSNIGDMTPPLLKMTVDNTKFNVIGIFSTTTTIPEDILE